MDFEAVFNRLPTPTMVMDPDFNILAANDACLDVAGRAREGLVGRKLFDVFPSDGAAGEALRASFERVREKGVVDALPMLDHPIAGAKGGLEPRRWSCAHVPILSGDGRVAWIMQTTQDISGLGEPAPREETPGRRIEMIQALNQTLLAATQHLNRVFMQASNFMCVLRGPELVFESANANCLALIGGRDPVGRRLRDALPELAGQGYYELLENIIRDGEAFAGRKMRVLVENAEGELVERFLDIICQPVRDEAGAVSSVFIEGSDSTEIVRAEQRQALLIRELHHRVRNTLATVQGVMNTTARTSTTIEEFQEAFAGRIASLAKTHAIMTEELDQCVSFEHLLHQELDLYAGEDCGRVTLKGPPVELSSQIAVPLGMAVHELTTNAVKYGALAAREGRLDVEWSLADVPSGAALRWEWRESDGPQVEPPRREGFGSMLLKRVLSQQIGAEVNVVYDPDGFTLRMLVPLRAER
ncbi:sensor histidine kinase [Methylocella sp.]|uniref:sensor histidine kinase n=1 Tax=Methylocella sp. TaxID=1978226 RepID=UPI003783AE13